MNSPPVNIVSVPYSTQIKYVTSFTYCVYNFIANKSITLGVNLYDSDGYVIDVKNITMDGIDYENWGTDDNYLLNYICSTLGFTITTPPPPPIINDETVILENAVLDTPLP